MPQAKEISEPQRTPSFLSACDASLHTIASFFRRVARSLTEVGGVVAGTGVTFGLAAWDVGCWVVRAKPDSLRNVLQHRLNPVHYYCRLKDMGVPRAHAQHASGVFERKIYRPSQKVCDSVSSGCQAASRCCRAAWHWCLDQAAPKPHG
jgi:hypothetical protein